jgi:hypothetical protein
MSSTTSKLIAVGVAFASLAFFSGCASITRGTKDTLVVESDPSGANVRLSTGETGKTPTSFQLPRKNALDVYIEKQGYEPLTVHVSSQISGSGAAGMAGNVLVGGLIGAGVDAVTGATKDLRPNPVKVTLVLIKKKEEEPNKTPEPTPIAVTSPAAQEPRQL